MPGKQVRHKGNTIHYQVTGKGPALLLLHGFLESSSIWEALSSRLGRHFFVVAPDLPGHGNSHSLGPVHTMQQMAESVRAVLDAESIDSFVVVGHSMGGYAALALTGLVPRSVKGLCLFHSHAEADTGEGRQARDRTIEAVNRSHTWFIRQFIPDLFAEGNVVRCATTISRLKKDAAEMEPAAIIAALKGMRDRPGSMDVLVNAAFPVMFLVGQADKRLPYERVLEQAAQLPSCRMHLVRDAGHMGWAEAPDICYRAINSFSMECFGY